MLSFCNYHGLEVAQMETGKLSKIVKLAERLGCVDVKQLEELYKDAAYSKLDTILSNDDHPLHNCFQLLPSGVRINISGCTTNLMFLGVFFVQYSSSDIYVYDTIYQYCYIFVLLHCFQFLFTAIHVSSYKKFHVQRLINDILSYICQFVII